ncbi:aminodeoxychorismate lyase [Alkalicoccus daliensis]|uniref:4-amino-4-deoxychorismate lyase n=1 Tax=Alkalicoccus daliensis TaxID=745820 RepID=A0A1H0L3H4_9BACI|nr:aminodeoxychorismate lyase [Alkalicoccus daliensis]SDO62769.1 4-amino-4-deoxychorismate lyase [Alkalicoccus daliensis]
MFLYVNGEIKKDKDIHISPYEHGFLYGAGLFETFRTYEGVPFLLTDHMDRLKEGAGELNVKLPSSLETDIREAVPALLKANGWKDGYFRLNISGGAEGVGLPATSYNHPLCILYVKPLPAEMPDEKKGATLQLRRNSPEGEVRRKSHHYWNNILAKRELGEQPGTEGIFLTEAGVVSEGITSNIFFVKNEKLFTPDESCGCLRGITGRFVQHAALALGLEVYEGRFSLKEAQQAEEVFVTNSIQEIIPLSSWDDISYPGASGPVTKNLQKIYSSAIRSTIEKHQ